LVSKSNIIIKKKGLKNDFLSSHYFSKLIKGDKNTLKSDKTTISDVKIFAKVCAVLFIPNYLYEIYENSYSTYKTVSFSYYFKVKSKT
jgi:hypothetical protein